VGVAPDGRHARFPALGAISGDWGGGYDVGLAALSAAARSEDGRGPTTRLEQAVPAYFDKQTPSRLAEAIHLGEIPQRRLVELAPVVFDEAATDPVAAGLVDRLAGEVVALAEVALRRLDLLDQPVEVLLGGGLFQRAESTLVDAIRIALSAVGTSITVRATAAPPIVGAALLGLDQLGANGEVQERVRRELAEHPTVQSERPIYG
jgi:N-acetylglucosamine kinase-like BadF-type ATPase